MGHKKVTGLWNTPVHQLISSDHGHEQLCPPIKQQGLAKASEDVKNEVPLFSPGGIRTSMAIIKTSVEFS